MDGRPPKRARHGRRLSERRAWEILSVVSAPLRGRIRLVSTGQQLDDLEIIHTYDWLELTLPSPEDHAKPRVSNALRWVEDAGQICALWHLLSCCPGFSAHENGPFWKRAVEALSDSRLTATRPVETPSVGLRFFEGKGKRNVFPRFLLVPPEFVEMEREEEFDGFVIEQADDDVVDDSADWLDSVVRMFLGITNYVTHNREVASYADELRGYADLDLYWNKTVEIGVRILEEYPFDGLGDVIQGLYKTTTKRNQARLADPMQEFASPHFPKSSLVSLLVDDKEQWEDMSNLVDMLMSCPIEISSLKISLRYDGGKEDLEDFFHSLTQKLSGRLSRLSLDLGDAEVGNIETVFSYLPFMAVRSIRFVSQSTNCSFSSYHWTWLTYALFHPYSTWREIDLQRYILEEPRASAMLSVHNAQAAMYRLVYKTDDASLTDATSGTYAFVRIRRHAKCFNSMGLNDEYPDGLDEDCEETAVLSACVNDLSGLPKAVCVIQRWWGVVWVAREDIIALRRLPANTARVTHARFGRVQGIRLARVIENFPFLQFLDVAKCYQIDHPTLISILKAAPQLKALKLESSGGAFGKWTDQTTLNNPVLHRVRLRSLHIIDPYHGDERAEGGTDAPSLAAWRTCLWDLREFIADIDHPCFAWYEQTAREIVVWGERVEYLVWNNRWNGRDDQLTAYDAIRRDSRQVIHGFRPNMDIARLPFSSNARIAFMSVVRHHQKTTQSVVGKLYGEVAERIFSFATTDVERQVWINSS